MEDLINQDMISLLVGYCLRVVGALALLFVAWIVAGWTRRRVRRTLEASTLDVTLTKFLSNFARWAILLIALISTLGVFGVETTSFAALVASAGLAVGLAFQGTLSNFSSGIMLLVFRPFKVGDVVNITGQTGKIDEIELFTTKMDTPDNRRIILPNSLIFGSTIENITHHPKRRADVDVGTDYGADLDRTREILEAAAAAVPGRLTDEDTQVVLVALGDSSIAWQVRVWANTSDFLAVKQRLTRDVKKALDEAGVGIPFPQMDVHLDGAPPQ